MSDHTIDPSAKPNTCPGGFEMPSPVAEHRWLEKYVGEWESEGETFMGPDKPSMKLKGTEKVRSLGFFVIGEIKSALAEMPYEQVYTIGYDGEKKKYVGTVVDTMTSYIWPTEGTVDESGEKLTLLMEGPCPMNPSGWAKFRESTEFKSADHRIFMSEILGEDGQWFTLMRIDARRK